MAKKLGDQTTKGRPARQSEVFADTGEGGTSLTSLPPEAETAIFGLSRATKLSMRHSGLQGRNPRGSPFMNSVTVSGTFRRCGNFSKRSYPRKVLFRVLESNMISRRSVIESWSLMPGESNRGAAGRI